MIVKILKFAINFSKQQIRFVFMLMFRLVELFVQIFPSDAQGCRIRGYVYKPFLKKCGKNFQVAIGAKLEHLKNIEVGDNVYIGHGSWINGGGGGIVMEDEVMLGPYVTMISGNHALRNNSYRYASASNVQPIIIKRGSWLASHSTVTYGTVIGEATLVAAGAVVTKDTPKLSIVGGVPAVLLKKLNEKNLVYGNNKENPPKMDN